MSDLIQLAARFRVYTEEADGWIIATSPLLHVVTQGRSVEEALDRVREEIQALFAYAVEKDLLQDVIRHRMGLSVAANTATTVASQSAAMHWLDVDLPIEALTALSKAA